jgi:hypothetical protein
MNVVLYHNKSLGEAFMDKIGDDKAVVSDDEDGVLF